MKKRVLGPALLAMLLSNVALTPVQAQPNAGDVFGLAVDIMRIGVEADRRRTEQTQRDNAQTQRDNAQTQRKNAIAEQQRVAQQAQAQFNRRVQTALKALGFYTMAVDGDLGPGSRRALAEYQQAFGLYGDIDAHGLELLEYHAAQGWRSLAEAEGAAQSGFGDRASYVAAQQAGFDTAQDYQAARSAGFADAQSYDDFLRSGAGDKASFEAQQVAAAQAGALAEQCLAGRDGAQWSASILVCSRAVGAAPGDASLRIALDNIVTSARAGLAESEAALAEKQAELSALLSGEGARSEAEINALRAEINGLTQTNLVTGLHLQVQDCSALVGQGNWTKALPACWSNADIGTLSGEVREIAASLVADLAAGRKAAEEGRDAEAARLDEEARRLALSEARGNAETLLGQVADYADKGNAFARGVDVARALVNLRSALGSEDAARINAESAALGILIEADEKFVAARAAMEAGRVQATQTALMQARRQADIMDGFVLSYISANVTSDHVPALLDVSEALGAALADGNGEVIVAAQASARAVLDRLGLNGELDRFAAAYNAPQVSADDVARAEADAANAGMALHNAVADGEALLNAIEDFTENGGRFADTIGVARTLARLKASLAAPILADVSSLVADLTALVEADAAFVAQSQHRSESQGAALANAIALAREELGGLNDFLLGHIARNLTDDAIIEIVDLQAGVEAALAAPDSARIVAVHEQALAGIAALGLAESWRDHARAAAAQAVTADGTKMANGLSVTPANAALLDGDGADLLVLRISDGSAPHLAYDLLGNLRVEGGVAEACWAHAAPGNSFALLMARQALSGMGVPAVNIATCEAPVDIVLARRADLLASPPSQALPFVAAFEDGRLDLLVHIEGRQVEMAMAEADQQSRRLATDLGNGALSGFGLLALPNGSGGICSVIADFAPHARALAKRSDAIGFYFPDPRMAISASLERAFVSAQRGQCSGLYAEAAVLKSLSEALGRIEIAHDVAPIWIEAEEVEREATRLAEEASRAAQQAEAAAALQAELSADRRSALEKQQAESRAAYQDRADAAHKDIADLVRALVSNGSNPAMRASFAESHDEMVALVGQKWTITDSATTLADYGKARWQGRDVDAVLVRVETERENALLGLYGRDCRVIGWLIDTEFRVNRDPFDGACGNGEALDEWQRGRSFASVWHFSGE